MYVPLGTSGLGIANTTTEPYSARSLLGITENTSRVLMYCTSMTVAPDWSVVEVYLLIITTPPSIYGGSAGNAVHNVEVIIKAVDERPIRYAIGGPMGADILLNRVYADACVLAGIWQHYMRKLILRARFYYSDIGSCSK